ncbi:uncharacterized protein [Amphiura filiformis]|uniref:uncharacterized protein n=1 Tax=Amphiura filiformis TaxID=82378 RepID=UPI003B211B07
MGTACSADREGLIAGPGLSEVPSFKIVLVGDAEVGKTSIFMRYFKNQFDYSYQPTTSVSIENVVKKLNIPEHAVVSVTIWDLPGREDVDLRKSYYKDVDAGIVVVNVSDKESMELAGVWKKDITNHAVISKTRIEKTNQGSKVVTYYENADSSNIPILLLGNKMDVVEQREMEREQAEMDQEEAAKEANPTDDAQGSSVDENKTTEVIVNSDNTESSKDDTENTAQDNNDGETEGQEEREGEEKKDLEKEETDEADDKPNTDSDKTVGFTVSDSEKQEEKEVVVWRYEEEQEEEVELPEEVQVLNATAEQYGFVGSVAVSAKHSDGGVHTAIQALIRHLLERKLKDHARKKMEAVEIKRNQRRRKRVKKVNPDEFQPLDKVNVPELDQLFLETNRSLHKVHETNLAHIQAMKQFRHECLAAGLIASTKCSIEDCIGGLKEALELQKQELIAQDDYGFVSLAVKGEVIDEESKSEALIKIMETFHTEVVVSAKAILSVCPTADNNLTKMDTKIADCYKTVWRKLCQDVNVNGETMLNTREKKNLQDTVEFNRARIKQAKIVASQNLQDVDNIYKKVKAAMLW